MLRRWGSARELSPVCHMARGSLAAVTYPPRTTLEGQHGR